MEVGHEDGLAKTSMGQFFTAVFGSIFFLAALFFGRIGLPQGLSPNAAAGLGWFVGRSLC